MFIAINVIVESILLRLTVREETTLSLCQIYSILEFTRSKAEFVIQQQLYKAILFIHISRHVCIVQSMKCIIPQGDGFSYSFSFQGVIESMTKTKVSYKLHTRTEQISLVKQHTFYITDYYQNNLQRLGYIYQLLRVFLSQL